MKNNFSALSSSESIWSAIKAMEDFNADYLVIQEESQIKGVVTSRELVGYPPSRLVLDCVIQPIGTISERALVDEASKVLEQKNVSFLVVLDNESLPVGVINHELIVDSLCEELTKSNDEKDEYITELQRADEALQNLNEALEEHTRELQRVNEKLAAEIIERRELAKALEVSKANFSSIVERNPDGILVVDSDGTVLFVNSALESLLNRKEEALVGELFGFPLVTDKMIEIDIIRNGEPGVAEMRLDDTEWEGAAAYLVSLRDITQRKRGEEELQKTKEAAETANLAKSQFLANMSHEIRTPMNGIIGMTELVLDTELTSEQREYLAMVKDSAALLLTLLNDILDFSKIEAGKLEFEPVAFDLRVWLRDIVAMFGLRVHQKGLQLACHILPEVPDALVGDPKRLHQVIVNLVGDAIKFTERGEVAIHVETESRTKGQVCLHFAVTDTGGGIPPDKQYVIFAAFSQADSSTTRQFGGTGLGLAISSQLIAMMGGKIWVESEVGKGSTFHFTARFDLQRKSRSNKQGEAALPEEQTRVALVVDDDEGIRGLFAMALANNGWKSILAESGRAALEKLEKRRFDLIFLDLLMPGMNGADTFREIRRLDPEAKVVIITGYPFSDMMAQVSQPGPLSVMTKPFTADELSMTLRDAAGGSETARTGGGAEAADQGVDIKDLPVLMPGDYATDRSTSEAAVSNGGRPANPVGTRGAEKPSPGEGQRCLHILLAEDNAINQRLATSILEKRGHRVALAVDGKAALAAFNRESFDIILMDVQMPEMDGLEATIAIREKESATEAHVPIVAMTAYAMKGDRERCLEAGMDAYVSKPIQVQELLEVIERLVPEHV